MRKILITGGKGQVGRECRMVLGRDHEVVSLGHDQLDISDAHQVERVVAAHEPDVIINCAAYTAVDACETHRDLAFRVNAEGPGNLAASAERHGAKLIHISTDYVFDGKKGVPEPYVESDPVGPVSWYGKTKLAGEEAVRKRTERYIILRTAWLYGMGGGNFLKTMLRLALKDPEREIRVVDDQFGSPTWAFRLALQIATLVEAGGHGIYHATSEGYGTWYELAKGFLDRMAVPHRLVPCTTADYPRPARRPMNAILENGRLKEAGLNLMEDWRSDLSRFISEFRDRLISEAVGEGR